MDAGLSLKAPAGVASADAVRPVVAHAPVTATELPQAKAVAPASETSPVRNDPIASAQATTREVVLDPQSREIVFRVRDASSRQVVRQVPEEALLRLRAYARAAEKGKSPADVLVQADVTA